MDQCLKFLCQVEIDYGSFFLFELPDPPQVLVTLLYGVSSFVKYILPSLLMKLNPNFSTVNGGLFYLMKTLLFVEI